MTDLSGKLHGSDGQIAEYFGVDEALVKAARANGAGTFQEVYDFVRYRKGIAAINKPAERGFTLGNAELKSL